MDSVQDICQLAHAVAEIVRQQGQHDFSSCLQPENTTKATLCGLSVIIKNGNVIGLKASDMEIVLGHEAANDEAVTHINEKSCIFMQGTTIELQRWHDRLTRFQTVFCYPPFTESGTA